MTMTAVTALDKEMAVQMVVRQMVVMMVVPVVMMVAVLVKEMNLILLMVGVTT